jgi:hypothetical protein
VRGLTAQVTAAIRLCQHILNAYFEGLLDGTIKFIAGPARATAGDPSREQRG